AAIYRHIGKNLKAGVGYNFTDFSDDLTDLKYNHKGVFLNLIATMGRPRVPRPGPKPPRATTRYPNRLLIKGYLLCLKFFTATISFQGVSSKRMVTPRRRLWARLPTTSPRFTT